MSVDPIDLIATLAFLILTGLAIRGLARNQIRKLFASGWPTTQGRIEFGSVTAYRTRYKDYYGARLDYSYLVNNEYYSGYYEKYFLLEKTADRFVENMKGQMVFIRYKPEKPERSAFLKQDQLSWPA